MDKLAITADADTLFRQAGHTAEQYLRDGIESIDRAMGDGFAAEHPELVVAFMRVRRAGFHTVIIKKGLDNIADAITSCSYVMGDRA